MILLNYFYILLVLFNLAKPQQLSPEVMKQLQAAQAAQQRPPADSQDQGQPRQQAPSGQRPPSQAPPQNSRPQQRPPQSAPEPTTPAPRSEREAGDSPDCTEEFYSPSGDIISPNYPENYPNEASCMYRIFTDKHVKFQIEEFILETSRDCVYDFVGFMFNATSDDPEEPQRYCGQGLDKIEGGKLSGPGPVVVSFRSDDSDNFKVELSGPDPCESNPCVNEATCLRMADYYECQCMPGYAGVNCEIDKDDCAVYPCKNGGQCVDGLESFTCECINYFMGDLCEIPPKPCESNPCLNGGLCVERIPDYVCSCPQSFMGDFCQEEIPTIPPPTTLLPATEPPDEKVTDSPETTTKSGDVEDEDSDEDKDSDATSPSNSPSSHGRGGVIAAVIIIILLALIIIGAFLWYWLKYHRKLDGKRSKEVTLINMKTKSHRGDRRKGNLRSHSTSIKSLTTKPNDLIGKLRKMSEDIIMEEVTSDSDGSNVKPKKRHSKRHNFVPDIEDVMESPNQRIKRLTIPMADNEVNSIANNPYAYSNDIGQSLHLSPDAAFNFLQHLKTNDEPSMPNDFASPRLNNSSHPLYPNYQPMQDPAFYPRKSNDSSYYPPNVPLKTSVSYGQDGPNSIALNPEEAADIVNHLLTSDVSETAHLKPNEALDFMRQLRDTRYSEGNRPMVREKTVLLNANDAANVLNSIQKRPPQKSKPTRRASMRDRKSRNIREYTPIREEDSGGLEDPQRSSDSEQYGKSPRNRKSQLYCQSIDPDEKVYDWLKKAPRRKTDGYKRASSPTNSVMTETLRHTRTFPRSTRVLENDLSIIDFDEDGRSSVMEKRTVIQTRQKIPSEAGNARPRLSLTENKAKRLVDKLVKAPMRSSENNVGPGLSMKRQNAFVG